MGWGRINIDPYLIEIKFTTGNRVRISRKQSEVAKESKENYFVLVVKGDLYLKPKLLAYTHLGAEEKLKIRKLIEESSYVIASISEKLIDAPAPEEVEPDINGYWVKKSLWSRGEEIIDWISAIKSQISLADTNTSE